MPWRAEQEGWRIGLIGPDAAVQSFTTWVDTAYPGVNFTQAVPTLRTAMGSPFVVPPMSTMFKRVSSYSAMSSEIANPEYYTDTAHPYLAAIEIRAGAPNWEYAVNMNISSSKGVGTQRGAVNQFAIGADTDSITRLLQAWVPWLSKQSGSATPGFFTLQLLMDRFIIDSKSNGTIADAPLKVGVQRDWQATGQNVVGNAVLDLVQQLTDNTTAGGMTALRTLYNGDLYAPQSVVQGIFPTAPFTTNVFYLIIAGLLPLFFVLLMVFPVARLVRSVVAEKETRLREGMAMMGVTSAALYTSWAVMYVLIYAIIAVIAASVSTATYFPNSNWLIIFLVFFLFGCSATMLGLLISVFFSRSKTAATVGTLIFLALYFPSFSLSESTQAEKIGASLCSPTAFALLIELVANLENSGQGATFYTVNASFDSYSLAGGIAMLAFDSVLYLVLMGYFDAVWPNEFGLRRKWYFPVQPSFWREVCGGVAQDDDAAGAPPAATDRAFFEEHDAHMQAMEAEHKVVKVTDLCKTFSTPDGPKRAVNGVNLTLPEGYITVLLGHNGAGKSTTISMMTGLIPATSGRVTVYGKDVAGQLHEVRESMGVCPQHDVLWNDLTVREHLQFFARTKGVPSAKIPGAVSKVVAELGLTEKIDYLAGDLSGGQKRKLSVGIALVGDSKFVVLDEPTSGMDPYSRRSTWQILQNAREGRCMLLTTHFMEEADLLGDRIAIMADGRVRCEGSPIFLKNKYGVGYELVAIKTETGDSDAIIEIVKRHVPEAEVRTNVGAEVSFQLPMSQSSAFPELMSELDAKSEQIGLRTYGVSVTTMESVFLRVNETAEEFETAREDHAQGGALKPDSKRSRSAAHDSVNPMMPASARAIAGGVDAVRAASRDVQRNYFCRHFATLLIKRFHFYRRDAKSFLFQLVIPVLAVVAGMAITSAGSSWEFPDYVLSSWQYNVQPDGEILTDLVPELSYTAAGYATAGPQPAYAGVLADSVQHTNVLTTSGSNVYGFQSAFNATQQGGPAQVVTYGLVPGTLALADWTLADRTSHRASKYGAVAYTNPLGFTDDNAVSYVVLSNSTAFFSSATYTNAVNRAIVQKLRPGTNITTVYSGMPFTATERDRIKRVTSFAAAIFVVLAFAFIPASYVIFVVKEKETSAKHLQIISGVSVPAYWTSNFAWDFTSYLLPFGATLAVIAAYDVQDLVGSEDQRLAGTLLLFLFYGISVAPFTYVMSYAFKQHSAAQNAALFLNLGCLILMIVSFVLARVDSTCGVNSWLQYIFMLLPGFSLANGLLNQSFLPTLHQADAACDGLTPRDPGYPSAYQSLDWQANGKNVTMMAITAVVYFALAILIDVAQSYPALRAAFSRKGKPMPPGTEHTAIEDPDVVAEARRVDSNQPGPMGEDVVKVQHLQKVYPSGKAAIRDISFGMGVGEIFALLGTNGAGKTSTFKVLSGDILPSSGAAQIAGYDVATQQPSIRRLLGYCPQFSASLFELLTVYEHLQLYARIKGVPESKVNSTAEEMMSQMGLRQYRNKLAGRLSGGNQRKLSVAVALVGGAKIVVLDEPSTGMDPQSRRFMWSIINRVATEQKLCSILLTSHSMEEVEALATRCAIMVSGQLRCIGSIQHLKQVHGAGYTAEIRVSKPGVETLQALTARIAGVDGVQATPATTVQITAPSPDATEPTPVTGEFPGGRIPESKLAAVCAALGRAERATEISASGSGWALAAAVGRSADRSVPLVDFATWWAAEDSVEDVTAHVTAQAFPGSKRVERHGAKLRFQLPPQEGTTLGQLFGAMETAKQRLPIKEYSLSQTSLEQVFNMFASQQEEERGAARGMEFVQPQAGRQSNPGSSHDVLATSTPSRSGNKASVAPLQIESSK